MRKFLRPRSLAASTVAILGISLATAALSEIKDAYLRPVGITRLSPAMDRLVHAARVLEGDPIASSSFRACIEDGIHQGLSPQMAAERCATVLNEDAQVGFGGDTIGGLGDAAASFDPQSVVMACASADPAHSQNPSPPVYRSYLSVDPNAIMHGLNGKPLVIDGKYASEYKGFSFGGDPEKPFNGAGGEPEKGEQQWHYLGLSEEESTKIKTQWVKEAEAAKAAYEKAWAAAKADPKNQAKQDAAEEARKKMMAASEKAGQDPNFQPVPSSRTVGESVCESVMDSVREMLRECNRNGWKSADCQVLHARMNGCPDPTKILVDPDAGYVCGNQLDEKAAAALAALAQAECERDTTPGPDGGTPCGPISVDADGFIRDGYGSVCSDPRAYVDGESGLCVRTMRLVDTGLGTDLGEVIQIGMERIGGPIIVLPGTQPRPPLTDPYGPK